MIINIPDSDIPKGTAFKIDKRPIICVGGRSLGIILDKATLQKSELKIHDYVTLIVIPLREKYVNKGEGCTIIKP